MEAWKHRWGILTLILCLVLILAAVWYCLFGLAEDSGHMEGTLVRTASEMVAS